MTTPELLDKIKGWTNGFCFTKAPVTLCNPFSTMLLLQTQEFRYHWFATGSPTYLIDLIRQHRLDVAQLDSARLSRDDVFSYNLDGLKVNVALFVLKYPNVEVSEAFSTYLPASILDANEGAAVTVSGLRNPICACLDLSAMEQLKMHWVKLKKKTTDFRFRIPKSGFAS